MDQLADYASSEEEDQTTTQPSTKKRSASPNQGAPDRKKRKLPALLSNLISPEPIDDPSKHQGRIRSHPHVEGQFASYIYVPINIGVDGVKDILKVVKKALGLVMKSEPLIHPIIEDFESSKCMALHISLSRPVYLFHHQREILRRAVKAVASSQSSFPASFANFTTFENDEKTRAFIAMEIGAGHSELRRLVESITPTLRSLYQKEYYPQPRFHASIAWALLNTQSGKTVTTTTAPPILSDAEVPIDNNNNTDFPSLPNIPNELITSLNDVMGKQLNRITFDVSEMEVRIGKQTTTYPLRLAC
ncbi:hypothetical protein Clacol_009987 [Clathrus columnatus]|uniref:U6 snRNA phosphodiesterase 1 n=1 Tax=Clathrus columnatus TaxID=1419009 RepID=A0AAV5ARE5_9AGAM|nr:hypothetical protein Clacol_009987 [Clathrus columnatus]